MDFKIPFSGRSHLYTEDEINLIKEISQNASPLTMGSHLKDFEDKFKNYISANYCFAMNSATSALELAAQLCNFNKEDEVIIPTHTYTSSCYPFIKNNAKIIWADISLETRCINIETISKCITNKTKAIVVPHLYGFCVDIQEIINFTKDKGIFIIEDAAQSLGSEFNKIKSGVTGDFGIFSFHSHKNITTLGEGGMLVVKDSMIANEIPKLRHNGHCNFSYERDSYWKPAMGNLDVSIIDNNIFLPNNYCLSEVQCALGVKLLDRIDKINKIKRDRALKFIDEMKSFDVLKFHKVNTMQHNYHLLAAYFDRKDLRDLFIKKMALEEKIQCVVQYYPLNRYDFYKKLGYGEAKCPNADLFFDNMVSFPFQSSLKEEEITSIIKSTKKILKEII